MIKYFKRKNHKDPVGYISDIYNCIDILSFQTEKAYDTYATFHIETTDLIKEYKKNLDELRRKVAYYADSLEIVEQANDVIIIMFNKLDAEFIYSKVIDLKYIFALRDTYHLRLLRDIPTLKNHPLLIVIQEGNFKARDIIQNLDQKIEEHKDFIDSVIHSHKETFKVIYKEDLPL